MILRECLDWYALPSNFFLKNCLYFWGLLYLKDCLFLLYKIIDRFLRSLLYPLFVVSHMRLQGLYMGYGRGIDMSEQLPPYFTEACDYLASPKGGDLSTPVSNTGGNSQGYTDNKEENPLVIDTLSLTGKLDDFPSDIAVSDNDVISEFISRLTASYGLTADPSALGGMNGYKHAMPLRYTDDRPYKNLGFVAWGGNAATYQLYLTGECCEYIHMVGGFGDIHYLASDANLRIKRIDIALDDFEGNLSIETAISLYEAGEFRITRNPKIRQIGNFIDPNEPDGRTVYIGARENGKMMRIYEKGKQLGDPESPWVRWELELKSVDRVIPLDVLLDYVPYYAGSYPALANFSLTSAVQVIKTVKKIAKIELKNLIEYAKVSYGKLFNVMAGMKGQTSEKLLDSITRDGVPKRLYIPIPKKSDTACGAVLTPVQFPQTQTDYDFSYV